MKETLQSTEYWIQKISWSNISETFDCIKNDWLVFGNFRSHRLDVFEILLL